MENFKIVNGVGIIPAGTTIIEAHAFENCTDLVSITIPDSVTEIREQAFYGCENLKEVSIPNSVTEIGMSAFQGCVSLTSIVLPNAIKNIATVFCGCTGLKNVILPDSMEDIGSYAFADCTSLETITLPNSVKNIYELAFQGCKNLKKIVIPDSVIQIYESAFEDCESLEELTLSNSLNRIDDFAFRGCLKLRSIFIPASVEYIGDGVFSNCPSLQHIEVDKDNEKYDSRDNCNAIIYTPYNRMDLSCVNTTIPDTVKRINDFKGICARKESIIIPETVTIIGGGAFEGCSNLKSISIPDSVTVIGSSAFEGCSSLEEITIGKSVSDIGNYAFRNCTSLKSIDLLHRLVSVDENIFEGCTSLEAINVPANTSTYYKIFLSEDVYDLIVEIPTIKLSAGEEYLARTQLKFMTMSPKRAYLMEQFFSAILERISIEDYCDFEGFSYNTPHELQIINGILSGKSLKEIGAELHLTTGRVRQLYFKGLRKLPDWSKMIKKRDGEIKYLKREILRLKNPALFSTPSDWNILSKPIGECDFSVSMLKCLEDAEIKTVADLVKNTRIDMLKLRNFGETSLTELDKWLETHGLEWGMELEPLEIKGPALDMDLLSKPIAECDFSEKVLNLFKLSEIKTVADLVKFRRVDLLKFRTYGKKDLREIDEWLEAHGLSYGMNLKG